MNDPHVETLRYHLRTDESVSYREDTPPVVYETSSFKATLEKNVLIVTMKEHFATPGEAMNRVDLDIRSWELLTALKLGLGKLRFVYDDADVIDRAPNPPSGDILVTPGTVRLTLKTYPPVIHITRNQYPPPPMEFKADPNVVVLWNRYIRFLQGGELLPAMAYFCLTVIEGDAGGRRQAAVKFGIHTDVLRKLGELTSKAGDESEARKWDPGSTFAPITDNQRSWIDAAIRKLIFRAGEVAANPTAAHTQITMANLPAL